MCAFAFLCENFASFAVEESFTAKDAKRKTQRSQRKLPFNKNKNKGKREVLPFWKTLNFPFK